MVEVAGKMGLGAMGEGPCSQSLLLSAVGPILRVAKDQVKLLHKLVQLAGLQDDRQTDKAIKWPFLYLNYSA